MLRARYLLRSQAAHGPDTNMSLVAVCCFDKCITIVSVSAWGGSEVCIDSVWRPASGPQTDGIRCVWLPVGGSGICTRSVWSIWASCGAVFVACCCPQVAIIFVFVATGSPCGVPVAFRCAWCNRICVSGVWLHPGVCGRSPWRCASKSDFAL